jgi:putative phosphoribosyl transferase
MTLFQNRADAGRKLAVPLAKFKGHAVVFGLPRGGVVVAAEIARELDAPLDVVVARKIGHPQHPEYAIGAVSEDGFAVFNEIELTRLDAAYVRTQLESEMAEALRRSEGYRQDCASIALAEKTAILVDDGVATGYTLRAAAHCLKKRGPKRLVVAVPVGPPGSAERFEAQVDEFLCLNTPEEFYAIGCFYDDFKQVSDETVSQLLQERSPSPT